MTQCTYYVVMLVNDIVIIVLFGATITKTKSILIKVVTNTKSKRVFNPN